MKEIKLNESSALLREKVLEAKVDETNLVFHNGLAIAKATVATNSLFDTPYIYDCMGVINENFEEAFCISSQNDLEKYVMFLPFNQEIIWAGSDSFRISAKKSLGVREGCSYMDDILLCFNRETFTLTSPNIHHFIPTKIEDIGIVDKRLYRLSKKAFLTHQLYQLQEIKKNTFYVVDKVISKHIGEGIENFLYDFLSYQIDGEGNVVSPVYSKREHPQTLYEKRLSMHCDEVYDLRKNELTSIASSFEEVTRNLKR